MGTFTLVGPGASVDRSQNNVLTWTWTRSVPYEFLHRWRLQYRTVGSGTWLNAVPGGMTNLLPNGSAEAGVMDWAKGPSLYNSTLSQVAGGRPSGGSWMARLAMDYVGEYASGTQTKEAIHPVATNTVAVVPGATYVAEGWGYSDNVGTGGLTFQWYKADGSFATGGTSYYPTRHRASQWDMFSNDNVAPSDAAYARLKIHNTARDDTLGWPSTTYYDDMRMYRVDNLQPVVVADAGGNAWSGRYCGAPIQGQAILGPNFLAAGNWEFRVEFWSSSYVEAQNFPMTQTFSNTVTSTMVTAAAAPTITSPTEGATVVTNPANVTVTYASGQTQLQIRVMDGVTEKYNTGTLTVSGTSSTQSIPFTENGVARQIQARTGVSGVFSAWATRNVSVNYTPPATPTITAIADDDPILGVLHVVRATVVNPTPTGTQPTVTETTFNWRVVGDTGLGKPTGVSASGGGTQVIYWEKAPNLALQVQGVARASNGTETKGVWVTVSPAMAIKGIVLHDAANTAAIGNWRLNDDGAEDDEQVESALLAYSGREYPVVEYGPATTRKINVPRLSIRTQAELDLLRSLIRRRSALVYRDKKGRAVLGRVVMGPVRDTFYGWETSLTIDVLDSWGK